MNKNQKGFAVLEGLLIFVVAGMVVGTGWYVWKARNYSDKIYNSAQSARQLQTYTDTAKIYTIKYPENWVVKIQKWEPCCEGESTLREPDWTTESRPLQLVPDQAPHGVVIALNANGYYRSDYVVKNPNSIDEYIKGNTHDGYNFYTKTKINGYDAVHHVNDWKRSDGSEGYRIHYYFISNGTRSVLFTFTEKAGNKNNHYEGTNGTPYMADFQQIVNSIKFLK